MTAPPLPCAKPEEMGIPTQAIEQLVNRLANQGIPLHSLLIARHHAVVFEGYYAPYNKNTLHRMFSVTKSLVSLAVGLLAHNHLICLDDSICTYFPQYVPKHPHPWLLAMTIRDMLQMKSCHSKTTYKKQSTTENWVESFFTTPPSHPSGRFFLYDTSATHTLCALVEQLTGQTLMEYLRTQFLDEIGFSKNAYVLSDPFGTSLGGSGLMALPSDLMRLGLLLTNGGAWNVDGQMKQLYPKDYLELATGHKGATVMNGPILEEKVGYGYQFWMLSHGGYGCYGMGGQLLLCYPEQDLIIVVTADTQHISGGNQEIYNGIYSEIFPCLSHHALPCNPKGEKRLELCKKSLTLPVLAQSIRMAEIDFLRPRYCFAENAGGFSAFEFEIVRENTWILTMHRKGKKESCPIGFGHLEQGVIGEGSIPYAACAAWIGERLLYICFWLIGTCTSSIHMQLDFSGDGLTVYMKKTEETEFSQFQGFLNE